MREIRLYGSEGGGAARSPYPYQFSLGERWIPASAGMTITPSWSSPLCASQGGENCGRLLCGVLVACDLELYRSRWVLRGYQRFDDADGVDGFGDGLHPGA